MKRLRVTYILGLISEYSYTRVNAVENTTVYEYSVLYLYTVLYVYRIILIKNIKKQILNE